MRLKLAGLMALTALAGCNTMSDNEFKNVQALAQGSPEARRQMVAICTKNLNGKSEAQKANVRLITNTSGPNFASVVCNRMMRGVASGRITAAGLRDAGNMEKDNTELIKVMQGR